MSAWVMMPQEAIPMPAEGNQLFRDIARNLSIIGGSSTLDPWLGKAFVVQALDFLLQIGGYYGHHYLVPAHTRM